MSYPTVHLVYTYKNNQCSRDNKTQDEIVVCSQPAAVNKQLVYLAKVSGQTDLRQTVQT